MHELAITQNMIQLVQTHAVKANAGKVRQINLVVGELSGYVRECVQACFDLMAKGTVMEAARLSFKTIPATGRCRDCDMAFEIDQSKWVCPECGGSRIQLITGNELLVDSIEVD